MNRAYLILTFLLLLGCTKNKPVNTTTGNVYLTVLGVAQDAGYPQAGCNKSCCRKVWNGEVKPEKVVSLGIVDRTNNKVYLFDATPDFKDQLHNLTASLPSGDITSVGGIFLTHAHIGHYTGLMHLGLEAMGAQSVAVYTMPKMDSFLRNNGPWSQLVRLNNIKLIQQKSDSTINLSDNITVTPFLVPHRQEYSETVGYKIMVNGKTVLFIPDIDKWQKWDRNIVKEVDKVDYAFLDATFYDGDELPNRNMSEIPHPFVVETMDIFSSSSDSIKNKIYLIHFNHTNPLLRNDEAYNKVILQGFNVAREGNIINLD
ncbi:MAG: MBL fold metallo-hydrolase [Bacteroidota bacterium]